MNFPKISKRGQIFASPRVLSVTALLAATLIASYFIFDHPGARAYWIDEAFSANFISYPLFLVFKMSFLEGQPLAYVFVLKVWSLVLGNSEISLRVFSALCSLLLILMLYKTSYDLFQNKKSALITVFLAATSYFLIWFSTQARPYTFAALLGLLSFCYLIRLVKEKGKGFNTIYVLVTTISLYAHPWMSLLFAAQFISFIIFRKEIRTYHRIFLPQLIIFILAIPNFLMMISESSRGANSWIGPVSPAVLWQSIKQMTYGSFWSYLIMAAVALLYFLYQQESLRLAFDPEFKRQELNIHKNATGQKVVIISLLLYLFFPLIAGVVISQLTPIYVVGRYEMFVWPAFILLAGFWLARVESSLILVLFFLLLIWQTNQSVSDDQKMVAAYKSTDKMVAAQIYNQSSDGDVVVVTDLNWGTFKYYLGKKMAQNEKNIALYSFPGEIARHPGWKNQRQMVENKVIYLNEAKKTSQEILNRLSQENRVWIVYKSNDPINELIYEELKKNFSVDKVEQPAQPREPSWFDSVVILSRDEGKTP